MATTDDIRAITSDKAQYDRATALGDGATVEFEVPNSPIVTDTTKVYVNGALQTLTTHYTVDEAVGVVTFVAAPANEANIAITYKHTILSDADITTFYGMTADTRLAAAMSLDTMASSEALVQKVITVMGLSTNGASTASALRAHAKALRDASSAEISADDAGFAIAEWVTEPFGWKERAYKEVLRDA